ncbi:MAG: glycosyltransferase [Phycisphaeraceae bacterium]|nr:glycosyltransferase [Phycisphaeraceae bacterium]
MGLIPAWLLLISAVIAVMTLAMTLINLAVFRRSDRAASVPIDRSRIDVCIPARNEQDNIEPCVRSILANDYPNFRVLIYDDQSSDGTPRIARALADSDQRVLLVPPAELPQGWIGKQWACWQLAQASLQSASDADRMLFIDADVRLEPDCLRRALFASERLDAPLTSTFPHQITGSIGERLFVPLIHFILLSYLPFARMRRTNDPAASAACGQFIMVRADAYRATGGHSACRDSMHEGVKMPRVFRRAGFHTDLFDGTDVCSCRMYRGWTQTWRGFAKNAYEGLGSVGLLVFCTVLHLVGHALPAVYLAVWLVTRSTVSESDPSAAQWDLALASATVAVAAGLAQRTIVSIRFRQGVLSVILHPVALVLLTVLQWHSFALAKTGKRSWRGRTQAQAGQTSPTSAESEARASGPMSAGRLL